MHQLRKLDILRYYGVKYGEITITSHFRASLSKQEWIFPAFSNPIITPRDKYKISLINTADIEFQRLFNM